MKRSLLACIVAACWATAPALADDGRPMPNRFLFTSLGWITSQPKQDYYPAEIPDALVEDWRDYAVYMREVGFTSIAPWGFLCNTFPYPLGVDAKSAGGDTVRISADKVRKARAIIEGCRGQGITFYYGLCLYFAYWQDYVNAVPQAAPKDKSALCPLYEGDPAKGIPGSIELMKQAIDFVMATAPVDGFAMESFHHGRCKCDRCLSRFPDNPRGTAEFHWLANAPVFEHIRAKHPKARILFCPEGPLEVIQLTENLDILKKTLAAVDYFIWCGATHPSEVMRKLAGESPSTGFMFRQEPWQSVPPAEADRDGWFFPNLVNPLGKTIHERAKIMDWAGVAGCGLGKDNPCDNVNLRFLAAMQMRPGRNPEAVAREILKSIYSPRNDEVLDRLLTVFNDSELTFRKLWPTWFMHIDFMPKGYKFTAAEGVEMVNAYQLALARLRAIRPELENQREAERLETSMVKWIRYIKEQLRKEYQYDMPGGNESPATQAAAPVPSGGGQIRPTSKQDGSIFVATGSLDKKSPAAQWGKSGGKGVVFVGIHTLPAGLSKATSTSILLRVPQTDHPWTEDTSADGLRMLIRHIDAADDTAATLADGASAPLATIGIYREPGRTDPSTSRYREFDVTQQVRADMRSGRASFAWRIEPESVPDGISSARYFPSVDNTDNAFPPENRGARLILVTEAKTQEPSQAVSVDTGEILALPVQRRIQDGRGGEQVARETWRVPLREAAFVTQHLWNNGEPDGPPQPAHLYIGSGSQANLLRTREINRQYILPALTAVRQAGMLVVHSEPGFIAHKWPQYKALVAEMTGTPVHPVSATLPAMQYSQEEMAKWTADTWPGWKYVNFPTALRPLPTEAVTMTSEELDHVLKKHGIRTLIYVGYATDMCLIGYTGGLSDMTRKFGYRACVLREATLATELADGKSGPQKTAESLTLIEREYASTAAVEDFKATLAVAGKTPTTRSQ